MKNLGTYENIANKENFYVSAYVIACDENAINNLVKNNLIDGKLPENPNEVVITSGNAFDEIGDTIIQTSENGKTQRYTIVGRIAVYNNLFESNEAITLLDRSKVDLDDKVDITVLSHNIKQIYSDYYDIYYQLGSYRDGKGNSELNDMVRYNKTLLEYENVLDYTSDFQKNIYTMESIFIGIVVICSVIFIYSIINISIIERKKYFGILKSIGATTKQMRRSIRVELFIILLATIPLGILLGIGLDLIIIILLNNLLPEITISYTSIFQAFETNEQLQLSIPLNTIFISILVIIITVYISAMIPIRKVSWGQTIDLIKHNKSKVRVKKQKNRKNSSIKNIELRLAAKNIERYKSRYYAIILSLIISITLIIVSSYYIVNIMNNAESTDYNYSIQINYNEKEYGNLMEKVIDDIQETDIADKIIYNSAEYVGYEILITRDRITDEEKEFSEKIYGDTYNLLAHFDPLVISDNPNDTDWDKYEIYIPILVLNEDAFNSYLQVVGVDKLERNECILVDYIHEKTKYYDGIKLTNYKDGDELTLEMTGKYSNLKIKKVTDKIPNNLSYVENGPIIIGTEETFDYILEQWNDESIDTNYAASVSRNIDIKVKDIALADELVNFLKQKYNLNDFDQINFNNKDNMNSIMGSEMVSQEYLDNTNLLINIFIYSFIGIVTFIGILNMYNAINTNLDIRKREIISLITIGMEKKQINKMLFLENSICGLLSLLLGGIIGFLATYLMYFTSIDYLWYGFEFPWNSVLICGIGIILIIIISTVYLKRKLFEDNQIEILKKEEI